MRRAVLWIIVIMTTFIIGVGIDRGMEHFLTSEIPKPAEPVAIYLPEPENEMARAVTSVTPIAPVKPNLILDFDQEKFSPAGYLEIMGPAPEGFKDFKWIELNVYKHPNDDQPANIFVRSGGRREDDFEVATADFALVTERTLYFTTSPSEPSGYHYRFEGEFLIKDFDSVDADTAVVRGQLTRFKNGRKIAEHTVTFSFFLGC